MNTSPGEGFLFKRISGSIDRASLNCKAWLCTGEYNTSGGSAHTHKRPRPLMGRDGVKGSQGNRRGEDGGGVVR